MSNLVKHAQRELELAGITKEDPAMAQSLVNAVRGFAEYGHSGGSAGWAIQTLNELVQFKPLTPLTDDPDEWMEVSEYMGKTCWQNIRDHSVFTDKAPYLRDWYDINDKPKFCIKCKLRSAWDFGLFLFDNLRLVMGGNRR
jgi:hypothetical protein